MIPVHDAHGTELRARRYLIQQPPSVDEVASKRPLRQATAHTSVATAAGQPRHQHRRRTVYCGKPIEATNWATSSTDHLSLSVIPPCLCLPPLREPVRQHQNHTKRARRTRTHTHTHSGQAEHRRRRRRNVLAAACAPPGTDDSTAKLNSQPALRLTDTQFYRCRKFLPLNHIMVNSRPPRLTPAALHAAPACRIVPAQRRCAVSPNQVELALLLQPPPGERPSGSASSCAAL